MTFTNIKIENFKCFKDLDIKFAPLTLLTGYNGAGKSSALQSLLLMSQTLRESNSNKNILLNGKLVRLGSATDVINDDGNGDDSFSFCFATKNETALWSFKHKRKDYNRTLQTVKRPESKSKITESLQNLAYISTIRKVDLDVFPYPDNQSLAIGDVGSQGEYAPYWYVEQADEKINSERCHPTEKALTIRGQIDAWFGDLFDGAFVNAEELIGVPVAKLSFKIGAKSGWCRQENVGFGLSYIFPILVALTCSKPGQTIIIDSPEAHLHPRAQSKLGEMLAYFASSGLQIIVESHSDHLLSGVRIAVKKEMLNENDVAVHFFSRNNDILDSTSPTLINIKQDGTVENWPSGFFDQSLKDLVELS